MRRIRLHPAADAEVEATAWRYEEREPGLGTEFLVELERVLDLTAQFPDMWPVWPRLKAPAVVRRALLSRFPFAVAYRSSDDEIVIYAVAHTSRRPGYWRGRLR